MREKANVSPRGSGKSRLRCCGHSHSESACSSMKRARLIPLAFLLPMSAPMTAADFEEARRRMIADQLVHRGISNPQVLAAMGAVPRHEFVPREGQNEA